MSIYDHLKQLHDETLYSNLVQMMQLLMPIIESGKIPLNPQQEYQAYVYYGHSLKECNDYRTAENIYQKALDLKKTLNKNKKKTSLSGSPELSSDIELKFQMHQCCRKLQDYAKATSLLESIPQRQRNSKINMALGELYERAKADNNATLCYKEVLKECPLAVKAINNLIRVGVKSNEIVNIVMNSPNNIEGLDWFTSWIKANSLLNLADVTPSITLLKQLLLRPHLRDNPELLISLGEALYYNGDYRKAISIFKKAYGSDPLLLQKMDLYASCLYKEDQMKELETLANQMIPRCESGERSPEPWIVLAYFCFLNDKKEPKSLYFAQKACQLSNNSVEALLLKGSIMSEARTRAEAISYFSEAHHNAPHRFEALKFLAEAYIADNRRAQAIALANDAFKQLGQTPRTLTLFASVVLSDPDKSANKKNAKVSLEKAVRINGSYLPAVYLLTNIYVEEKNIDKAIDTLLKALEVESNNKLHRLLGDCYKELNDHDKALHHHNIASKLEVNYRSGIEASQRLEQQTSNTRSSNVDTNLEIETEEVQESENEVDESETDVVWSDADF